MRADLAERARRHGLVREDAHWAAGGIWLVWETVSNRWQWRSSATSVHSADYPTEEGALSALVHWLDLQHPQRAWRPSPGAQMAEVVGLLWKTRLCGMAPTPRDYVEGAIRLLEFLALPPASDEGAVLQVAWDYLCERGGLTESGRAALVAAVRHHPEVLTDAKLAVWRRSTPAASGENEPGYTLWSLDPAETGPVMASVWAHEGRWHYTGPSLPAGGGIEPTAAAARETIARALPAWRILQAQPERLGCTTCGGQGEVVRGASRYGAPSRCPDCNGTGVAP